MLDHGVFHRWNAPYGVERIAEWDGQRVDLRAEANVFFDGTKVHFIDGRETEITLFPTGR